MPAHLGNPDAKVDEERILAAIESSRLSDRAKTCFRSHIFNELSMMWHAPVWTSRDFLPRNILLSDGQPFLVDFDLACKTGLLAIDVLRIEFYTGWQIPFWPSRGASRDDLRIQLLFLVLEEHLQRTIAGGLHHRKWVETFGPEIDRLAKFLPSEPRQKYANFSVAAKSFAASPAAATETATVFELSRKIPRADFPNSSRDQARTGDGSGDAAGPGGDGQRSGPGENSPWRPVEGRGRPGNQIQRRLSR